MFHLSRGMMHFRNVTIPNLLQVDAVAVNLINFAVPVQ